MIIKSIPAHQVQKGDYLTNIGEAEKVETDPVAQLTSITVSKGICKSAAFYWYDMNQPIQVQRNSPASSNTLPKI